MKAASVPFGVLGRADPGLRLDRPVSLNSLIPFVYRHKCLHEFNVHVEVRIVFTSCFDKHGSVCTGLSTFGNLKPQAGS